jgi:sRNA-binding protein
LKLKGLPIQFGPQKSQNSAIFQTLWAVIVFVFLCSAPVYAGSVASARGAFVQGDLPSTIKILEPELFPKPRFKGRELEDARELYGVTQFMLGNRVSAERVFRQIISGNPNAKLDKRYLLDPGVQPFFEALKRSKPQAGKKDVAAQAKANRSAAPAAVAQQRAGSSGRMPRQANSRPTPPPESPRQRQSAPKRTAPTAFTGVFVKVNAARATLFADGIFIGAANQKISLEQGVHQITISAEGYESQERQVRVQSGQVTNLSVTLVKAGSNKPKPVQVSRAKSNPARESLDSGTKGQASINFNQELPAEKKAKRNRKNFTDQYFQESSPPQYAQPQQQYSQPPQYPPQPPQYAPQPQYAPPQYQQVPQQPYGYPPPAYAAPPVYQAPQPYGYPEPYAQPQPSYPAPQAPAYGAPDPYEEEDEAGDMVRGESRSSGSSRTRKRKKSGGNAALALMPFGIGQFQNNHNVKGILFLAAEGGALGFGLTYRLYNIPKDKKLFDAQRAEETDLSAEEKDAIEIQREAHIKKLTNYSNYALMAAGGLYVIGVIDAFIYLGSDSGTSKRRRNFNSLVMPPEPKYRVAMGTTSQGGIALGLKIRLD